jgi:hypothetical protein
MHSDIGFKTLVLMFHFVCTEVDIISPNYFVTCLFLSFIRAVNLLKQTLLRGASFFPLQMQKLGRLRVPASASGTEFC